MLLEPNYSGRFAMRKDAAIWAACTGFLSGNLSMNGAIENSGVMEGHSSALALARTLSPSLACTAIEGLSLRGKSTASEVAPAGGSASGGREISRFEPIECAGGGGARVTIT